MTDPETPDAVPGEERAEASHRRLSVSSPVDPEDWAATPAEDDERYQRERPPHWE